ncbi:MAG: PHP domain-containing protein [Clostridia bacterium]|nr:PHP domain-containing protein [Clostridia bacterium]
MDVEFKRPDLHMHSVYSDGTDSPRELISRLRADGIDLFSLTDHDSFAGCESVIKLLKKGDPAFICGIEFSCRDEYGKYHILGYGFDISGDSITNAVEYTHNARIEKARLRIKELEKQYGFTFTEQEKEELFSQNSPGKPHIARMMLAHGYVKDKSQAFEIMEGYNGPGRHLTPTEAIDAILRSGGVPVLAHGPLGDGRQQLDGEEMLRRVITLKESGLMGLECFYSGFDPAQTALMISLAERHGMLVTAGSDYHGDNKTVLPGETGGADNALLRGFTDLLSGAGKIYN